MVIPLLFVSEIIKMVVILGLVSAGKTEWAQWFFHDWQAAFQLVFVVGAMLGVRWVMQKWWPIHASEK